jgi:hypothetical protein
VTFNDAPIASGMEAGDEATNHAIPILVPGSHVRMRRVCVYLTSVGSRLPADHEEKRAKDGVGREIDAGMLPHREL